MTIIVPLVQEAEDTVLHVAIEAPPIIREILVKEVQNTVRDHHGIEVRHMDRIIHENVDPGIEVQITEVVVEVHIIQKVVVEVQVIKIQDHHMTEVPIIETVHHHQEYHNLVLII